MRSIWLILLFATLSLEGGVVRAAIDVGMGGPKLQIAEVDPDANKIVKLIHTERFFVNFYEGLSQEVRAKGIEAFKNAVEVAQAFNADGIVAIATASLRSDGNGMEFASEIEEGTGVKVHIVDQSLEGKLTYQAVLAKVDVEPEKLVVWDIGGGSIQFTGMTNDGSCLIECVSEGVGAFTDHMIGKIQGHNLSEVKTPNPMTSKDILRGARHAYKRSQQVSQDVKDKIGHPATQVVGAGSVFGYGIAPLLGKNGFNVEELRDFVRDLPGKTDGDFGGGDYAFCEGTNAILAYGYMKGLGIQEMKVINVNNADGALIYPPFWN